MAQARKRCDPSNHYLRTRDVPQCSKCIICRSPCWQGDDHDETDRLNHGAFVLRLALGVMFLAHGLLKLVVFTPAGTAGFFGSIGLPPVLGYLTMVAEIGGGLALIVGFYTRVVAAALIPVLIGSIAFVHGDKGWVFSNEGGGWEYPLFLIAASAAQVLLGAGSFALDRVRPGTSAARAATA